MVVVPYTPVHALVALPFARRDALSSLPEDVRRWVLPALVAGSMVPDVPNFVDVLWPGAEKLSLVTHGLLVALTVDVALALALAALWVRVVGPAVLAALPRRSPESTRRPARPGTLPGAAARVPGRARRVLVVVASAAFGVLTHLLWDDVTHKRGYIVQAWDVLREPLGRRPVYVFLQHGSSALGVVAFVVVVVWWWRRAHPVEEPRHLRSGLVAVLVGAATGMLGAAARLAAEPDGVTLYALARRSATYPVLGVVLAVVIWAVVLRARRGRRDVRAVQGSEDDASRRGP